MEARYDFGKGQDYKLKVIVGCCDEANDKLREMAKKYFSQGYSIKTSCRIIENGKPAEEINWDESAHILLDVWFKSRDDKKQTTTEEVIGAYYGGTGIKKPRKSLKRIRSS